MMWPDLRKEAWSPGGISPGVRSHVYANNALRLTWTPEQERGQGREHRETGKWRRQVVEPDNRAPCQAPRMLHLIWSLKQPPK